ncbi:MAG TPA: FxSxx-COOH system tetratricopeptide repeat protein [Ktedonobacteraceae bacterium]|nr:FxSxx-COOH system tetratricopeptide repeat protein [Ktedonobacteraceae bacterium]
MEKSKKVYGNYLLRQERIQRNWRQRDLAEQLGTTVVTIKRWERGSQQPGTYFRIKLCALFGKSAEELGLVAEEHSDTPVLPEEAGVWSVPFPRNPFFTGRDLLLEQLHAILTGKPTSAALTQSYALSGLGGIGKTQLAIEYAYRHRSDYGAVLWVEAETQTSLTSSFVRLAALLALPEQIEEDQSHIVAAVLRWLNRQKGWLLIFDNVEDLSFIKPFLPTSDQGALLFTTRLQTLGTLAQRINLTPMDMPEGLDFLLARTNRLHHSKEYAATNQQEYAVARTIVTEMGGLPLALEQAGAYIDATQCSLSDYLHLFQQMRHRLLDEHEPSSDHPLSVNQTFLLAFEQVRQQHPLAAELLTACAFLAPEAIPEAFFLEGACSLGPTITAMATDPLAFPEAIKILLSYSLLQRHAPTRTITVHRLVQAVLKAQLTEAEQRAWERRVLDTMNQLFPADEEMQMNYLSIGEQFIAHAQMCLSLTDQWKDDEALRIPLLTHVAAYLSRRVRYAEAGPLFRRAVQMGERFLGAEHPLVAEALTGWANLSQERGKYTEAESLFERAFSIRQRALADQHPLLASSLNMLGYCYYKQGKYEQAENCYRRALHIQEQEDPEHHDIATSLYNLGTLYWRQGKYKQAQPLLKRALQTWEQVLGPEHLQIAFPLATLGVLCQDQGKYEQAEAYYQRAWRIREQSLGSEHPRVAISLNNVGTLYQEQKKYEQAEEYYQRALQIWKQALGPEHPDVATALNNVGELAYQQKKYEQAEEYLQQALQIWEQALGPQHVDTAYACHGLANLFRDQGKYEQAEPLYQRALMIRQRHLSPLNPYLAETLYDLARFHHLQQQTTEALSFYRQAQAIREQVYGLHHPKTEAIRNAITLLCQNSNHLLAYKNP